MLVLTRKLDEYLLLGDDIEVRVVCIEGDHVRLGIVAPRNIPIVRGELLDDIRKETASAATPKKVTELASLSRRLRGCQPP